MVPGLARGGSATVKRRSPSCLFCAVAILAVVGLVTAGCGGGAGNDFAGTTVPTTTTAATTTSAPTTTTSTSTTQEREPCWQRDPQAECSESEYVWELLTGVDLAAKEWNNTNLEWIAKSNDPEVGMTEFIEASGQALDSQTKLVITIRFAIDALPTADLQEAFRPLEEHFQARLDALRILLTEVSSGTQEELEKALADYREVCSPDEAIRMLETVLYHPTVAAILAAEGVEASEIIELLSETSLGTQD